MLIARVVGGLAVGFFGCMAVSLVADRLLGPWDALIITLIAPKIFALVVASFFLAREFRRPTD